MSKETDSFTYMRADLGYGFGQRWIVHDPDDHLAGEFATEDEARAAAERWNTRDGRLVKVDWTAPDDDADDSNRGIYRISIAGTQWSTVAAGGWHSTEHAARIAQRLRDQIAEHGPGAVIGTLAAVTAD